MSKRGATLLIFTALILSQGVHAQDTWDSDPLDVLEQKPEVDTDEIPKKGNFQEIDVADDAKIFSDLEGSTAPPVQAAETVLPAEEIPAATETVNIPSPEIEPIEEVMVESAPEPPPVAKKASAPKSKSRKADIERIPDEPDLQKENRIHRIYSKYNTDPTPVESWDAAVANRPSKSYLIQKKDTLSGVSEMLFGDPHYWPKIWSQNSGSILNPHIIQPGLNVSFYPGSLEDIPTLDLRVADGSEVIDTFAEQRVIDESGVETVKTESIRVQIPPPRKKPAPLLTNLPPSLPQVLTMIDQQKEPGFNVEARTQTMPQANEYLSYYVRDQKVEGVGKVRSVELDLSSAGENQYIYVVLDEPKVGTYVVEKNLPQVKNFGFLSRNANLVEVQGEIKVLEVVNSNKNIYRAIVTKSISPIEVGALLSPGKLQMVDVTSVGQPARVPGAIIGGQFSEKRHLIGANSYAFVNAGKDQGMSEGMVLPVFEDANTRTKTSDAYENDREIAQIKIVKVSDSFSTGYILWASEEIHVGDLVGRREGDEKVSAIEASSSFEDDEFSNEFESDSPAIESLEGEDFDNF